MFTLWYIEYILNITYLSHKSDLKNGLNTFKKFQLLSRQEEVYFFGIIR